MRDADNCYRVYAGYFYQGKYMQFFWWTIRRILSYSTKKISNKKGMSN